MTLLGFCARKFTPVGLVRSFSVWLADIRGNRLPVAEWIELWREFNDK